MSGSQVLVIPDIEESSIAFLPRPVLPVPCVFYGDITSLRLQHICTSHESFFIVASVAKTEFATILRCTPMDIEDEFFPDVVVPREQVRVEVPVERGTTKAPEHGSVLPYNREMK